MNRQLSHRASKFYMLTILLVFIHLQLISPSLTGDHANYHMHTIHDPAFEFGNEEYQAGIYRLIGNDMPPLQSMGQLRWNTKYALLNENYFPGARKRWLLNRIWNDTEFTLLYTELIAGGVNRKDIVTRCFIYDEYSIYPNIDDKLLYVTSQNEGRNTGVQDSRDSGFDWSVILDGNTFITSDSWAIMSETLATATEQKKKYVKLPYHRLHAEQDVSWLNATTGINTVLNYAPMKGESQLAIHKSATSLFSLGETQFDTLDPTKKKGYGQRNKAYIFRPGEVCGPKSTVCACANVIEGNEQDVKNSVDEKQTLRYTKDCGLILRLWGYPPANVIYTGLSNEEEVGFFCFFFQELKKERTKNQNNECDYMRDCVKRWKEEEESKKAPFRSKSKECYEAYHLRFLNESCFRSIDRDLAQKQTAENIENAYASISISSSINTIGKSSSSSSSSSSSRNKTSLRRYLASDKDKSGGDKDKSGAEMAKKDSSSAKSAERGKDDSASKSEEKVKAKTPSKSPGSKDTSSGIATTTTATTTAAAATVAAAISSNYEEDENAKYPTLCQRIHRSYSDHNNGRKHFLTVFNEESLRKEKEMYAAKDPTIKPLIDNLLAKVNGVMKMQDLPRYSVMTKKKNHTADSKRYYYSARPYFWPVANVPYSVKNDIQNGLLEVDEGGFVYRDGISMPGTQIGLGDKDDNLYDQTMAWYMINNVTSTALAWYYTGEEKYAIWGAAAVRKYFLDPVTGMLPDLQYAQDGDPKGIFDWKELYYFLDAIRLLEKSGQFTLKDMNDMQEWCDALAEWLMHSPQGELAGRSPNHEGLYFDLIMLSLTIYSHNDFEVDKTRSRLHYRLSKAAPFGHFALDGSAPHEESKHTAFHLVTLNLLGWVHAALMVDSLRINAMPPASFAMPSLWLVRHEGETVRMQTKLLKTSESAVAPSPSSSSKDKGKEKDKHKHRMTVESASDAGDGKKTSSKPNRYVYPHPPVLCKAIRWIAQYLPNDAKSYKKWIIPDKDQSLGVKFPFSQEEPFSFDRILEIIQYGVIMYGVKEVFPDPTSVEAKIALQLIGYTPSMEFATFNSFSSSSPYTGNRAWQFLGVYRKFNSSNPEIAFLNEAGNEFNIVGEPPALAKIRGLVLPRKNNQGASPTMEYEENSPSGSRKNGKSKPVASPAKNFKKHVTAPPFVTSGASLTGDDDKQSKDSKEKEKESKKKPASKKTKESESVDGVGGFKGTDKNTGENKTIFSLKNLLIIVIILMGAYLFLRQI